MPKYEGQTIPTVRLALPRMGFGSRSTLKSEALPPLQICPLSYHIRTELGLIKTRGFARALALSQHSKHALRGLTHLKKIKKCLLLWLSILIEISFIQCNSECQHLLHRKSLSMTLHEGFTMITFLLNFFFLIIFVQRRALLSRHILLLKCPQATLH